MKFRLVNANVLLIPLYLLLSTPTLAQDDVYGVWLERDKGKVAVIVEDCEGKLCGYIYWLKKPLSSNGKPKLDKHNPDESKRKNPRCGLKILSDFTLKKHNYWSGGSIYNPSNGRTYRSFISVSDEGKLNVSGYVGIPLFGIKTTWIRPKKVFTQCY